MIDQLKSTVETQLMRDKQKAFHQASLVNQEINKEHRALLQKYHDGILLYSAAAFSFTLTIIGVLDKSKVSTLQYVGFLFPNVYWLYFCWIMFLISCVMTILSRKFDAYYSASFGMEQYTKAYHEKEMAEYEFSKNNPGLLYYVKSKEETQKITEGNIKTLKEAIGKNKRSKDLWYLTLRLSNTIIEISAFLGVAFLLIFAIQFSQNLIWK